MNEIETVRHLEKIVRAHLKGKPPKIQYEYGWCGGAISFVRGNVRVILRYSERKKMYYASYDYMHKGEIMARYGYESKKPFVIFKKIGKLGGWRSQSSRYRRVSKAPRL